MGEAARRVRAQEAGGGGGGQPNSAVESMMGRGMSRSAAEAAAAANAQPRDASAPTNSGAPTASWNQFSGPSMPFGQAVPQSAPQAPQAAPQVSAPQIQGPAAMPGTTAPQLQTRASAPDPTTQQFLGQLGGRLAQQQAGENAPVTASAERATNLARRDIGDAAAAQKKMKGEELAARGLSGGSGAGAGQLRAIDEAARTRGARASADIGLAREGEQDRLNLARTGMTNVLYGQMGSASQVPFQQQMQGNQQALDTFRANDASQMGRAGMNLQAQTTNAQLQMQQQQMQAQQQQQQQQQQQAMWMALMGQR